MLDQKFIAVKKNKQAGQPRARRPGGPGRLRSWSGPVETDFQGRLRFSYANRPAATWWLGLRHPGVLGSGPKREEPGKTGAPCFKVPGGPTTGLAPLHGPGRISSGSATRTLCRRIRKRCRVSTCMFEKKLMSTWWQSLA